MPALFVDQDTQVDIFADRAKVLVSFLVEHSRDGDPSTTHHEKALAEWIDEWQRAAPEAQHFMAVELGIILRALNGPAAGRRSIDGDCQRVSWVLARRMSRDSV